MDVFFFQAEDGIRDIGVTGVQTCALPIWSGISAGTELLCYRGQLDPDLPLDERIGSLGGTFRYPLPYGYSCVGTVERSDGSAPAGSLGFADRKSTRLNSSHANISYAVFCLKQ